MKTSHYFYELPEGYTCVKTIDAKDKKTAVLFILVNLLLLAAVFAICAIFFFNKYSLNETLEHFNVFIMLGFLASMFIYIVLHELVHGLFYKIFTHEKLTFGLTLTVAYCGVPNLYVKRGAAIVTTLAPFVVFNLAFVIPMFFIPNPAIILALIILLSFHIGGCVGDLYGAIYLIFKNRKQKVIMNDTGPKQTFYVGEVNYGN